MHHIALHSPVLRPSTSAAPQAAQPVLRTPEEAERSAFLVMVNSVLRCLRNADRALNTDDLKNMAGVDLTSDAKLRKEIQTNPRVNYDQVGDVYLYKPKVTGVEIQSQRLRWMR